MDNPTLANGCVLVPLRGKHGAGRFAKIDHVDHEKVSAWRWYVNHHGYSYGQRSTPERIRLQVFMHHLVLHTPEGKICDHINGDRLDNRRANLRVADYSVNNRNRGVRSYTESAYKGVIRADSRWTARVKWKGRNWYLGGFDTEEEAARVYDSAALFLDPHIGRRTINFPGESEAVSLVELRRRAYQSGNLNQKSSPFRGVHWKAKNRAFQAFCVVDERTVYLGLFDDEEAAARAHDSFLLYSSGNAATLNFSDSEPRSRESILNCSLQFSRPPKRRPKGRSRHGYAGVVFHARARNKPWQARINLGNTKRSLGYFETLDEAARAYDAALVKAGFEPVNF